MTLLGRVCRLGNSRSVVLFLVIDICAIGHELHRILVDLPGSGVGKVAIGHLACHLAIPSLEGIAFLAGVLGLRDSSIVFYLRHGLLAIDVEGQLVLVDFEYGGVGTFAATSGVQPLKV